ncbi:hypothetical protein K402DRAFT_400765 [Aulographum hederae CBS 113979]|uniref:Secreted protein n=1 Tax=Aulographum hederae CBS 113979 TaxID=1176131 RepID=A0A6G1HBY2_9PEZI|nr:hypothetical protein K402DRAFT_400765 [Aulographum hederae CBS 113979]
MQHPIGLDVVWLLLSASNPALLSGRSSWWINLSWPLGSLDPSTFARRWQHKRRSWPDSAARTAKVAQSTVVLSAHAGASAAASRLVSHCGHGPSHRLAPTDGALASSLRNRSISNSVTLGPRESKLNNSSTSKTKPAVLAAVACFGSALGPGGRVGVGSGWRVPHHPSPIIHVHEVHLGNPARRLGLLWGSSGASSA